ncbi:MAG: hypothetical protein L7F77_11410 [Candidatus Magnetominusculus sp. LBB02]|nr:hypothetical protein [Candidatus Magnetominusculus sp. LBB02]
MEENEAPYTTEATDDTTAAAPDQDAAEQVAVEATEGDTEAAADEPQDAEDNGDDTVGD